MEEEEAQLKVLDATVCQRRCAEEHFIIHRGAVCFGASNTNNTRQNDKMNRNK